MVSSSCRYSSKEQNINWIVRAVFGVCIIYAHWCVIPTHAFTFKASMFLSTNMILAYIPVEISLHMNSRTPSVVFWTLFPLWLLFYPNAPYMITDFFHLAKFDPYIIAESGRPTSLLLPDIGMWAAYTVLTTCILVAVAFGVWSIEHVTDSMLDRIGARRRLLWKIVLVASISALAGIGIYLGRFPRMHSVHLFLRTRWAFEQMAAACGKEMLAFTGLMTIVQMTIWGLFKVLRRAP